MKAITVCLSLCLLLLGTYVAIGGGQSEPASPPEMLNLLKPGQIVYRSYSSKDNNWPLRIEHPDEVLRREKKDPTTNGNYDVLEVHRDYVLLQERRNKLKFAVSAAVITEIYFPRQRKAEAE